MPRAPRICRVVGCPEFTYRTYCDEHRRAADKARGTKAERGYDAAFQRARRRLAPEVAAGRVTCWRCGHRIGPDAEWHLGHDDDDRSVIRGPEHAACNLSAAGRASHRLR